MSVNGSFAPEAAIQKTRPRLSNSRRANFAYVVLGFILLGLSFGQSSGSIASNFGRIYRYTASALTSDLAWLFGAGFAPLAALMLANHFGLNSAGTYLLSGAVCTLIALWLGRPR